MHTLSKFAIFIVNTSYNIYFATCNIENASYTCKVLQTWSQFAILCKYFLQYWLCNMIIANAYYNCKILQTLSKFASFVNISWIFTWQFYVACKILQTLNKFALYIFVNTSCNLYFATCTIFTLHMTNCKYILYCKVLQTFSKFAILR